MDRRRKVLFVDDEPELLRGLRRMLMSESDNWDMHFSDNPQAALAAIEDDGFELVIADLIMPGMNGVQLLTATRERRPDALRWVAGADALRIVLSGHSDRRLAMQAVGCAHQFLAKPLSKKQLVTAISRCLALRDFHLPARFKTALSRLASLPVESAIYDRLKALSQGDEPPTTTAIGKLFSLDMGLTAEALRLVNSAYFGLPMKVSSPAEAVMLVGQDIITDLVVRDDIFSRFQPARFPQLSLGNLNRHSRRTAHFAKAIAQADPALAPSQDVCFLSGLLHDVGKLVLAEQFAAEFQQALALANEKNIRFSQAEKEVFGVSHAAIGAYLLSLWGFPPALVEAVRGHQELGEQPGAPSPMQAVLHAADAFERQLTVFHEGYASVELDRELLAQANVDDDAIQRWLRACASRLAQQEDEE